MVLDEGLPSDFTHVEIEYLMVLESILKVLLQLVRIHIVEDPLVVHEVGELLTDVLAFSDVVLKFSHVLLHVFGSDHLRQIVHGLGRDFTLHSEGHLVGLRVGVGSQLGLVDGLVILVTLPIREESRDRLSPSHSVAGAGAAVRNDQRVVRTVHNLTGIVLYGSQGSGFRVQLSRLLRQVQERSQTLVNNEVDRNLIANELGVQRQISQDTVASNCVETTKEAEAIGPAREWLCITGSDDRWSQDEKRNHLLGLTDDVSLLADQELFSHALREAVVVRESLDNLALFVGQFELIQSIDFLVFPLPVFCGLVSLLIDEPSLVSKGEQSRYLAESLEVMAFLGQTHQHEGPRHIHLGGYVQPRVKLYVACRVDDVADVFDELLPGLWSEPHAREAEVHGDELDLLPEKLRPLFMPKLHLEGIEDLRILNLCLVSVVGLVGVRLGRSYADVDTLHLGERAKNLFENYLA
mmetsp:Transcript_1240/g.1439  ORF Transcript_1240/g.1439 Transcript_1240/m.1439 type:complete len:466 (-) Transcript_1240:82-1479(-)